LSVIYELVELSFRALDSLTNYRNTMVSRHTLGCVCIVQLIQKNPAMSL